MLDRQSLRLLLARSSLPLMLTAVLPACSNIQHKPMAASLPPVLAQSPSPGAWQGRHIAVFLDGTRNDEGSDTNVKRLHSLVALQNRADISSLYVQGVGVKTDLIGAASGSGINARVRLAYEFIYNHYAPGDKLYIFGFSRGAYSARQLASMLYYAGLPKQRTLLNSEEVAGAVHQAVFPVLRTDRLLVLNEARFQWARQRLAGGLLGSSTNAVGDGQRIYKTVEVDVEVLGLWDTVEALGVPDYQLRIAHRAGLTEYIPDIDEANFRYGEKLCNVHNAFHALSIDDNREWIFTPLLLARPHLFRGCVREGSIPMQDEKTGQVKLRRLQEVWFAGAHSDVGGGYDNSLLSGTSLNWMIEQLQKLEAERPNPNGSGQVGTLTSHSAGTVSGRLLPPESGVRQDIFGSTHNAELDTAAGSAYRAAHRNLVRYANADLSRETPAVRTLLQDFQGTLCVHPSAFERRGILPLRPYENPQLRLVEPRRVCLVDMPRNLDPGWTWSVEDTIQPPCTKSVQVMRYPDCPRINQPTLSP